MMTFTGTVAAICTVAGILLLRNIVDILPSLAGCLLRWKECMNLEDSTKLSQNRDIVAVFLIVPFCLVVTEYRLYNPEFLQGLDSAAAYPAAFLGIFIVYLLLRIACRIFLRSSRMNGKTGTAVAKTACSYFCILVTTLLCTAGICSFSGVSAHTTRLVLLYLSLGVYLLYLLRKFQIFKNYCSFFTAFLYLCASEILPTGILALSAVFL